MNPEVIRESVNKLVAIFHAVRPLIMANAGNVEFDDKHDGSPVTEIDRQVEETVISQMQKDFPNVPLFGEETGYDELLPPTCWLIDPIDGTKSFVAGDPYFTSMGVLIDDHRAVACVIYNHSTGDTYVAYAGGGAFKNDQKLDLHSTDLPDVALCKDNHIEDLNNILRPKSVSCQVATDGGGHGFTTVADGRYAARFQLQSRGYIHDYAVGALLVREAGGDIIPILEDEYTYKTKSFVACHPALTDLVRSNLDEIRKLEL